MEAIKQRSPLQMVNPDKASSEPGVDVCFHGYSVHKENTAAPIVGRVICDHGNKRVFVSKCLADRKCDIAVKEYSLRGAFYKDQFQREQDGYKYLMERPHRHIVRYYGGGHHDDKGFLVMELGDANFGKLLENEELKLSISEFNEICHQLLSLNEHFEAIGFAPQDYSLHNMVYSAKDKAIKLIDLEMYSMESENPERFSKDLKTVLNRTGLELLWLQLQIKCREEGTSYGKLLRHFSENYSGGQGSASPWRKLSS